MSENKFIDGFWANKPHEKAPDFVKGEISIDLSRFAVWVKTWKAENPQEKYLKITIKESKKHEFYAEVNDWKPKSQSGSQAEPDFDTDITF